MFESEIGARDGGRIVFVCVILKQLEAMTGNTITIFMQRVMTKS